MTALELLGRPELDGVVAFGLFVAFGWGVAVVAAFSPGRRRRR